MPTNDDDQWGPELKRAWERGVPAQLDAHRPRSLPLPTVTRRCRHVAAGVPQLKLSCGRCGVVPVVARSV